VTEEVDERQSVVACCRSERREMNAALVCLVQCVHVLVLLVLFKDDVNL